MDLRDENYRWAEGTARGICRSRGAWLDEDLLQEVHIALLLAARSYDPVVTPSWRKYARRKIYQALLDAIRLRLAQKRGGPGKARRTPAVEFSLATAVPGSRRGRAEPVSYAQALPAPDSDPLRRLVLRDEVERVRAVCRGPRQREFVDLLLEGHNQTEAAGIMGVSRNRVTQIMRDLRARLNGAA